MLRSLLPCATAVLASALPVELHCQVTPQWKLEEVWRVGGEVDGPHSFDANMGLVHHRSGSILHMDWKARRVHVLDSRGQPVRSFGRPGKGPGELAMPVGLLVLPTGNILIKDLQNGYITYSLSGKFLSVHHPKSDVFPNGRQWNATALDDGSVIEVLRLNPSQNNGKESARLMWDSAFSRAVALPDQLCGAMHASPPPAIPLKTPTGRTVVSWPVLFAVPWTEAAYARNGIVWEPVPQGSGRLVKHHINDCTPLAAIQLGGQRAPLGARERKSIATNLEAEARRWQVPVPSLDGLPSHQAWYQSMTTDSDGNLWVERVLGQDATARVEVFSSTGRQIGWLDRPLPSVAVITNQYVFGFDSDDDGVRYLVAYRIVRR